MAVKGQCTDSEMGAKGQREKSERRAKRQCFACTPAVVHRHRFRPSQAQPLLHPAVLRASSLPRQQRRVQRALRGGSVVPPRRRCGWLPAPALLIRGLVLEVRQERRGPSGQRHVPARSRNGRWNVREGQGRRPRKCSGRFHVQAVKGQ